MVDSKRILYVENDPEDGDMLAYYVQQMQPAPEFIVKQSLEQATRFLEGSIVAKDIVDMVIIDLHLSYEDGFKLIEFLRSNALYHNVIIVIMSNTQDQQEIHQCYEQGVNCFIPKAETHQQLQEIVDSLLHFWFKICVLPEPRLSNHGEHVAENNKLLQES